MQHRVSVRAHGVRILGFAWILIKSQFRFLQPQLFSSQLHNFLEGAIQSVPLQASSPKTFKGSAFASAPFFALVVAAAQLAPYLCHQRHSR
jgi:hypothetical protein